MEIIFNADELEVAMAEGRLLNFVENQLRAKCPQVFGCYPPTVSQELWDFYVVEDVARTVKFMFKLGRPPLNTWLWVDLKSFASASSSVTWEGE